jgi:(S)-2-hydroxyglutarate dehydrogenase
MNYDIVIVGGGIVGLATALRIKEANQALKVVLLEKEYSLASHQTGNNSGVIHSGIYYKPGSLKATNCIDGYKQLIDFCQKEGVKYEICGKLIVATTPEELPRLDALYERGLQNGLDKIKKISADEIKDYEPYCVGLAAIVVPYTGIIDYKEVCAKYAEIFTIRYGGEIFLNSKVTDIKIKSDTESEVITLSKSFTTKLVINTAGLYCDKIAAFNIKNLGYRIIPFRGEYSELKHEKEYLVKNLIYPVPDPAFPFLGVHFTRMIKGGIEAGPNAVFAFKREGYTKSDFSLRETMESLIWPGFQKVMRKYWKTGMGEFYRSYNKNALVKALKQMLPEVSKADLKPGGAGVRAQACDRTGGLVDDFVILEDRGILNVLNAPSPAATASLSIGKHVAELALKRF